MLEDKIDLSQIRVLAESRRYPGWVYASRAGLDEEVVERIGKAMFDLSRETQGMRPSSTPPGSRRSSPLRLRLRPDTVPDGHGRPAMSVARFFSRMSFRTKIELAIGVLVMGTALLLAMAAGQTAADALKEEHRKRGLALSEILAARTIDPLLARDLLRLKNIVDDLKRIEGDVLYAFIQDEKGHVLVHTFPGGFPSDLIEANFLPANPRPRSSSSRLRGSSWTISPPR
jgi:hypothetical protein